MRLPDCSHPHFAEPAWLVLALLGPVLLVALMFYARRARRWQLARLAAPEFLEAMLRGHSAGRRHIKQALLVVAVFVMVVMKYFSNVAWTMFAGGMVLSVMLDIYYDIRKCWDLQEK